MPADGIVGNNVALFTVCAGCAVFAVQFADKQSFELLHLGIQNIKLGPTLPAFISPNVLAYLVEHYHIAPITTPEADLKEILGA